MKVLVVEDEKKIASLIRKDLEARGFVVDAVHHGDEGYVLATTRPYDVLVLDIMLPGRDGLSILRQLRERGMDVPVLLLTARGELNERLEGLHRGRTITSPSRSTWRNSGPASWRWDDGPPARPAACCRWRTCD